MDLSICKWQAADAAATEQAVTFCLYSYKIRTECAKEQAVVGGSETVMCVRVSV